MKQSLQLILLLATILAGVSCGKSTEKYAQKEYGKKFGSWEMHYSAGDYDVYWPSIVMSEKTTGRFVEVTTNRQWFSDEILSRDTTTVDAWLKAKIYCVKSRNDAKYYNSIRFMVCDTESMFYRLEHRFVFSTGQKDSLSFSAKPNEDGEFVPTRSESEQIIKMLCGTRKPIDIKITHSGRNTEGEYSFIIDGCPKLKKGLELNQERKIMANKEFDKKDRKAEKEFLDLFSD